MARTPPEAPAGAGTNLVTKLDRLVPDGILGLAVSGGPDSLALLLLAAQTRPGRVRAATVDHGLRPESAEEAAMVAGVCANLGVPHDTLAVTVAGGASLQARARAARYAALGGWADSQGIAAVATAHHRDDQAETLLMRLARGSGVGGLAGVRETAVIGGLRVVRPLLNWSKAELAAVVERAGLVAVDDPANADPRHDRTRVRALLADGGYDAGALARSAAALADAEDALAAFAALERARAVREEGDAFVYRPQAPREIRRRVVLALIGQLAPGAAVRGGDLERLLDRLERASGGTLAGVVAAATDGAWTFRPAPPRRG